MEQIALTGCKTYRYEEVRDAVDFLWEKLSLSRFIKPGMMVAIKPNLVMKSGPEGGVATHPLVVAAIGTKLKELGADVIVVESPGGLYTPQVLRIVYGGCGYLEMSEKYGIPLNFDCSYIETEAPQGIRSRQFQIISPILNADLIVDVAKLKTHCMTGFSGAVKNMFGTIPGLMKPELHCRFPEKPDFCEMLIDLCELVRPQICFMDGIIGMEGNGPTGGNPRFVGALLAGTNPYALDLACTKIISMKEQNALLLRPAARRGVGPASMDEVEILGDRLENFQILDFQQPESRTSDFVLDYVPKFLRPMAKKILTPIPKIRESDCIGCGRCAQSCPQHTIHIEDHTAKINYQNCIRCYCCHEMCPERAIDIKRFSLFKL